MRDLHDSHPVRIGVMSVVILVLVIGVGQSFSSVPILFAQPTYYAQFTDTGGLNPSDRVRLAGVDVGAVRNIAIEGNKIVIGFSLGDNRVGTQSRASIRTDTILGRKLLEIEPRGPTPLAVNGVLPVTQTTTPYQIADAISDVTTAAAGWDTQLVKKSLNVLSETVSATAPHLSAALDGVARFSDTIGKRDEQIKSLLANANRIARVVGNRSEQIHQLFLNAQALLTAIDDRGRAIDLLLERTSSFSKEVSGFLQDNPNLHHVITELGTISDQLLKHKNDLAEVLSTLSKFTASLAEAVGSGPYFKVMVANVLPYQILQPWVDAAFKKRGIDPEEFWRNSGLPSFRFPDPNGKRFANGAPPPAPTPREGTADHPGPAVVAGSPCSYTPPRDGLPSPGQPLPCALEDVGPFGPNPYGADYSRPDVAVSVPDPRAHAAAPGVPSAAVSGQVPPAQNVRPAPPYAPGPPGARTIPVNPGPTARLDVEGH